MKNYLISLFILILINLGIFAQDEIIQGDVNSDLTFTSDKTYLLRGFVRINSGATLTIQPGTIIYGENATQGTLIIKPGGKIMAEGSADSPIIFTSEYTKPGATEAPAPGDWGGIMVLGNAPINSGTASIEGPGDTYGGDNPDDNSGILKYIRIEYPGIAFSPNNEINGLTFGGVGSGTTVDYIQVSYSGDDSFEWFGGNVNCKHLIAYRGWDDDFDTDFGYNGKLQFLVGIRDPEIADVSGSNGFESDNDGSGSTAEPRTGPTWWNVTLVGPLATSTTSINANYKRGMHLRRASQNKINNTLILGWPTGVLVDGTTTINEAAEGTWYIKNSIISGAKTFIDTAKSNGAFDPFMWFTINGGFTYEDNNELKLVNAFNIDNPIPVPTLTSPINSINGLVPPEDGFFDRRADYIGAFQDTNWTKGWSTLNLGDFTDSTTTSVDNDNIFVESYSLAQNYPNPFNPSTSINYSIEKAGNVKLTIYNILGMEVKTLINEYKDAGSYIVKFNASDLTSGVYIYRLEAGPIRLSRIMTVLK